MPRVYIETYGCQMNIADTERAQSKLRSEGYEITDECLTADVIFFNTCSVRERAEQKVYTRIGEIKKQRIEKMPLLGVMGCVAQLEGEALFERSAAVNMVAGTQATDRLHQLIERSLDGEKTAIDLGERKLDEGWDISPAERHSPYIGLVPIIEGCNKFCTYCIVPYSRGRERSRPASEIIREVERLKSNGFQEIQLIGQNVNSYRPKSEGELAGFRGATPFSRLLRAVAATGMPRIKFTTSFPRDFHTDIVAAIDEHENLCNWVHLPVQSGNDRILKAMRRGYKVSDYLSRVEAIKNARRKISLTSDIIIGFPGESVEEFEDTMRLVEQCEFDGLYIFKYSERSGTPAAKLEESVTALEKRERFLALEKMQMNLQQKRYEEYVGREVKVLVERKSARSSSDLMGHTTSQKVVNFASGDELLGKIVDLKIVEAKSHSLYGQLLPENR